jgi:hypothetical protein
MDNYDLKWTAVPPTEIGYYWARRKHLIGFIVKPVEVGMNDDGEFGAFEAGWGSVLPITNYTHWLGPLRVPRTFLEIDTPQL